MPFVGNLAAVCSCRVSWGGNPHSCPPTAAPAQTPYSSFLVWPTSFSLKLQLKSSLFTSLISPSPTQRYIGWVSLNSSFLSAQNLHLCTHTSVFSWLVCMTFPPLDHENSKLRALPITLFQSLAQYLHLVHKECLLKSNEATRQVLVVTSTPPSCHVAMASFDV